MTEAAVRAVWRALDPAGREAVDAAVTGGRPAPDPALATVAVWRTLRRRKEWRWALLLSALAVAAAGVLLPAAAVVLVPGLGVPAWRLWLLQRALYVNVALALDVPQRGTPPARPATSELRRHLAARASRRA